jgi:acyl carrier protein
MSADYFKEIRKIIEEKTGLEPDEITLESFFEDDLNLGEMELIEILNELEEKYHTDILEEKDNIETVQDLVDILSEKIE